MANFDLFSDFEKQIGEIHNFEDDNVGLEHLDSDGDVEIVSNPGDNVSTKFVRGKRKKQSKQLNFEEFINDDSDCHNGPSTSQTELLRTRSKQKELEQSAVTQKGTRGRGRGRGRARGRKSTGRGKNSYVVDSIDLCSPSANLSDSMVINDDDDHQSSPNVSFDSENYDISVKVYWNLKLHKLLMRRFQKFDCIIQKLGELENVNAASIVLTLEDKILSANDTPESVDYKTSQFIYGRTMEANLDVLEKIKTSKRVDPNAIEIKIQSALMKKPLFVQISKQQNMKIAIIRCAEELKENANNIQLRFDGDIVDANQTPDDLELEGGEIFDVIINKT